MQVELQQEPTANTNRYARCIENSQRIAWDIERDVIRGRRFDFAKKFLPDSLSLAAQMDSFSPAQTRLFSQIQGRSYANIFGLVERFIVAKVLEVSQRHFMGDQVALEALVGFSSEELKHQALFRRLEQLMAEGMSPGYKFLLDPDEIANAVLGKSTWAVLALTCHIELFTQAHYRQSIEPDTELSELWQDVFLFHWQEESQHAILDELEWRHENAQLTENARDLAVSEFIDLVCAVDGMLQVQAGADAIYFAQTCGRVLASEELAQVSAQFLKAYRWQYIVSGVQQTRFSEILGSMLLPTQAQRIFDALAPLAAG